MPRLSKIGAAALGAFGWTSGSSISASYLQVAGGGGGGGYNNGGGGGAGGYLAGTTSLSPLLSYTVTVGAGGAGGAVASGIAGRGANGSNSSFGTLTASVGGGGGGCWDGASGGITGNSGGSGGGGGAVSAAGGAATSGQGFAGGTASTSSSGGGGGSSAVGANSPSSTTGGAGGAGTASSISGTSVTYAGGGGGSANTTQGAGGSGGGAAASFSGTAASGTANLGGGGGGVWGGTAGGQGGSGVVIISYLGAQQFGGGVVTSSGGNTIHTFNTSGTLSPLSSLTASYLIVAGGGGAGGQETTAGGGGWSGGGGGAGGMLTGSGTTIDTNSTYLVTVGSGGAGGTSSASPTDGTSGSSSAFSMVTTTAVGGGGGGKGGGNVSGAAGLSGGSGGGGGSGFTGAGAAGGAGTSGQGSAGGTCPANSTGGGGGGKGGAGGVPTRGAGSASSISGASVTYATGGLGQYLAGNTAGTANTGNGGDNGTTLNSNSLAGGSGVVIISYAGATQSMAGGTVTISGGNVIHTFTSSGYLTPLKLVNNSLRFRLSASAYLNRTGRTATNGKTCTYSFWLKRGVITASGVANWMFTGGASSNVTLIGFNASADTLSVFGTDTAAEGNITTAVFRDPAAWYHVVVAINTAEGAAADRAKIYVNSVQQAVSTQNGGIVLNSTWGFNTSNVINIGRYYLGSGYFDGYLTEVNFIDGQTLTPNSFGTFNSYGVWQPITYGGSYGTNGFYLPFTNTTSTTTLGYDFSPNGNNWTVNNISLTSGVTYDSFTDVPTLTSATTANYAVGNPLAVNVTTSSSATLTNGNLYLNNSSANYSGFPSTMSIPIAGKWAWKFKVTDSISGSNDGYIGFACNSTGSPVTGASTGAATNWYTTVQVQALSNRGIVHKYAGGSVVTDVAGSPLSGVTGDEYEFLIDRDAGTTVIKLNGTTLTTVTGLPATQELFPYGTFYQTGGYFFFNYTPSDTSYKTLNTYNI